MTIKRFPDGTEKPFLTPHEYAQLRDDDRFLYNEGPSPSARITGDKDRENPVEGAHTAPSRDALALFESTLKCIAGSHYERFGIDQTDIEEIPDMSAEEAMNLARDTLMAGPSEYQAAIAAMRPAVELEEARDILSALSSYLGAGLGDDATTLAQFDDRIRWGIDHIGRVYRSRAAQVVEECSKRPGTTWGAVKRAILDDTCLPTAQPAALQQVGEG